MGGAPFAPSPGGLGLAAVVAAEGVGSLLYHGAASDVSQFLHDVPLIGALAFVAGWHVGRLRDRADAGSLVGLALGLAVSSVLWAVAPEATNITAAVAVAVIVVASLLARRHAMAGVWSWPLLALGAVAVSMWGLGTPDSPVCDADSWLQAHAVWHVLTAIVALAWVDCAYGAADPDHAPRMFRRFTDRSIGLVARGLVLAFHRSVDVRWRERLPRDRPVLIVANHGNGFVDPVLVAGVLGRLPRFLAKAALWKVVAARPFLGLAGVLPVYRTTDGDRASDNTSRVRRLSPRARTARNGGDLPRGHDRRPPGARSGEVGRRADRPRRAADRSRHRHRADRDGIREQGRDAQPSGRHVRRADRGVRVRRRRPATRTASRSGPTPRR